MLPCRRRSESIGVAQVITQLSPATSAFIAEELSGNAARFAEASSTDNSPEHA